MDPAPLLPGVHDDPDFLSEPVCSVICGDFWGCTNVDADLSPVDLFLAFKRPNNERLSPPVFAGAVVVLSPLGSSPDFGWIDDRGLADCPGSRVLWPCGVDLDGENRQDLVVVGALSVAKGVLSVAGLCVDRCGPTTSGALDVSIESEDDRPGLRVT